MGGSPPSHSFYAPLWLSNQSPPQAGASTPGVADGELRVIDAVLWPGAEITVVEDRESVVERPTRTVSIAMATSPPTPTRTESLLGRWPELGRYVCFIVVTFSAHLLIVVDPNAIFVADANRGQRDAACRPSTATAGLQ